MFFFSSMYCSINEPAETVFPGCAAYSTGCVVGGGFAEERKMPGKN
jgi:hypothetical protein